MHNVSNSILPMDHKENKLAGERKLSMYKIFRH